MILFDRLLNILNLTSGISKTQPLKFLKIGSKTFGRTQWTQQVSRFSITA